MATRVRAVRALLAVLLVAATSVPLLLVARGARAAEPESWARISIDAISPALPDRAEPDQKITISGRITNTSDIELSNLQVAYWRSLDPIETAEGMTRALESDANEPLGARAEDGSLYVNVPSESDRTLEPDESTSFTISATLAQLELPDIDGVYLVGVHLRGRTDPNGPDITVGRGRAFLPVVSETPKEKVRQTSIVVLTSQPSLLRTGVFLDDHLVDELSGQGRLTGLLQAARAAGTSFAVDPALVQEVQAMVTGYRVLQADGSTRQGIGTASAQSWLSQLTELIRVGDGYRLPYGNPDVAALVHHDWTELLTDSVKIGAQVTLTQSLPLLILPGNGTADEGTVQAAADQDPAAILLSDATLRTDADSPVLTGPGRRDSGPLHRRRLGWRPRSAATQHTGQGAAADAVRHLDRGQVGAGGFPGRPGSAGHRTEPERRLGQRGDGTLVRGGDPDPAAHREARGLVGRVPLHRQGRSRRADYEPARRHPGTE